MAAIEHVDSQFLCQGVSPMRSFARDEGVHTFSGGSLQLASGPSCHDTNPPTDARPAGQENGWASGGSSHPLFQIFTRKACFGLEAQELVFLEEERAQVFQTKRSAKPGVIAKCGMSIQRQMRTIERQIVFQEQPHHFVIRSGPGASRIPKKSVMDQQ